MVSQKARIFPNKIERCTLAPSEPPTPAPSRHSWKEVTHGCSGRAKARLPGAQAFVHLSERLDGLPSTLPSSRAVHCPLSFSAIYKPSTQTGAVCVGAPLPSSKSCHSDSLKASASTMGPALRKPLSRPQLGGV